MMVRPKSFKQVSTAGVLQSCLQDTIKEASKVKLDGERDKTIRSTNLIIHGVEIGYKPKAVLRLGKRNSKHKRPLKVAMTGETETDDIMLNL